LGLWGVKSFEMNIGITMISSAVFIEGVRRLYVLQRDRRQLQWVIKAQRLAALSAIAWAILHILEEVWSASLDVGVLSYMKLYSSILFGLCLGILLTLWISGQLSKTGDKNETD